MCGGCYACLTFKSLHHSIYACVGLDFTKKIGTQKSHIPDLLEENLSPQLMAVVCSGKEPT